MHAGVFPIDDRTIGWLRDRESYIASAWAQRKSIASDVDGHGKHPRINPRTIKVPRCCSTFGQSSELTA
jgi:hypothetical protein